MYFRDQSDARRKKRRRSVRVKRRVHLLRAICDQSQVDRDLLLLRDSPAKHKIAILIDRDIDPTITTAYYRKRPSAPYPVIWLSEVLLPDRAAALNVKLAQYVLGSRLGDALQVSRQLRQTAHNRVFAEWLHRGLDIYTGHDGQKPTFIGVMYSLPLPLREREGWGG